MSKPTIECSNCNQCFEAHYPYCPYCGQQAEDKLTIGVLFTNTISNYFSFDARFFRSFIPLMLKPGYLAQKFVQGKRLLYIHPAQIYLFISVVLFFLFSFIATDQAREFDTGIKKALHRDTAVVDSIQKKSEDSLQKAKIKEALEKNKFLTGMNQKKIDSVLSSDDFNNRDASFSLNSNKIDSLLKAKASDEMIYKEMGMDDESSDFERSMYKQLLKFYKEESFGAIVKSFYDTIPIAMFILLPIFALFLKIFYYNRGSFAHHLVFTFYFFSFLFTVFAILVLLRLIWNDFPGWIIFLVMLSTYFYFLFAVRRFYQQGIFLSFIKTNIISFLFLMLVIPSAAVIIGITAFMFH